MAIEVTHSTAADGTFSSGGVTAWDAAHTVTGLATVATSGVYSDLTSKPTITPSQPAGRLTLTTALPVTTADVTAATSIYYTPYKGDLVPIYSGSAWSMTTFTELTLALDSTAAHTGYQQSGKNFDLFVVNDAGTIRLGTGPAWTSDTGRGTGAGTTQISMLNGILTNTVSMTLRFGSASGNTITVAANQGTYVGTMRASADGQCEDSLAKRFLCNCYNDVPRVCANPTEGTNSWTYSAAAFQQANANSANKFEIVRGLNEKPIQVWAENAFNNSTATQRNCGSGIGISSTTVNSAYLRVNTTGNNGQSGFPKSSYFGCPGLGYYYLAWLEYGAGTDTQTWYGDAGIVPLQTGIDGVVMA